MDIYVVLNVWNERTSVAGAGTSRQDAEQVADRMRGDYTWSAWTDWPSAGDVSRHAFYRGGDPVGHQQEIVRVPLAGMAEAGELSPKLRDRLREEAMRMPAGYAIPGDGCSPIGPALPRNDAGRGIVADVRSIQATPPGPAFEDVMAKIRHFMTDHVAPEDTELRVGNGTAYEMMTKILDRLPRLHRGVPDVLAMSDELGGVPVIVDPSLPPDVIRMGASVFVVAADGATIYRFDGSVFTSLLG